MLRAILLATVALLGLAVPACTSVSGTGRSQFNVMSPAEEKKLGASAYTEMLAEPGVKTVTSGPDYERVQRVGKRITAAAARLHPAAVQGFEWEWTVIDDPHTVNAWALPGGKSAVYTGMLTMAKNDDELAVVMGHEASHAIARHGGERISSDLFLQGALQGAQWAVGGLEPTQQDLVLQAIGAGSQYGVVLPWSRMQESEADELGLFIAADAGYDPRTAIGLWQRMGASADGKPPEFMSTHPSEGTRVERLTALMPKAMQLYRAAEGRSGAASAAVAPATAGAKPAAPKAAPAARKPTGQ